MNENMVVLVDQEDNNIGSMEKLEAHKQGHLHRAFSILVFNQSGDLLIQKRANDKYHSGGLWANTCCSHPRPQESVQAAAHRRLKEEMGFDCELQILSSFTYKIKFENGLVEHELDHVLIGQYDGLIESDEGEVSEWKYISVDKLKSSFASDPHLYSEWFKLIISKYLDDDFNFSEMMLVTTN